MDVGSTQHPHAAAAAAAASNPGQQQQRVPTHLIVMVNGLWGFQRDWNKMQQALQAADRQGKCLIHVSSVNTGAQTYYGIDVCGARLASEITQITAAHPSLTTISLLGHSMGGLIARYALGLLSNPKTCQVAGLNPGHFVSIAAPHLGCCSDHPEEVAWQDRPWMHWLTAAVRAGHLEGAVAATTQDPAAVTAAAAAVDTAEPATETATGVAGSSSSSKVWPWSPCRSVVQLLGCDAWAGPAAAASPDSSSSSCSSSVCFSHGNGGQSSQLHHVSSSSEGPVVIAGGSCCCSCCTKMDANIDHQQEQGSSSSSSSTCSCKQHVSQPPHGCCSCCGSSTLVMCSMAAVNSQAPAAPAAPAAAAAVPLLDVLARDVLLRCSSCGTRHVYCFLSGLKMFQRRTTYSSAGGDHLIPWASSSLLFPQQLPSWPGQLPGPALWARQPAIVQWPQPTGGTAEPPNAVAEFTNTRQEIQQEQDSLPQPSTGAAAPAVAVAVGLANTQQQQDSLLQQQEQKLQPTGSTAAHADVAAGLANTQQEIQQEQDSLLQQQHQQDTLLEQQQQDSLLQQQEQQPSLAHSSSAAHPPPCSMSADKNGKHDNAGSAAAAAAAAAAAGPLSLRLLALQSVGSWCHFHVVWPRLCLGSSHCNIQYNGPFNFVGKAVVDHVVAGLLQTAS